MIAVTQFLDEEMGRILKAERSNECLVHLYHVNDCWSAVEKSAYYLSQFVSCNIITLFADMKGELQDGQIVLASTSEVRLANARKAYSIVQKDGDHLILKPKDIPTNYAEWHKSNLIDDLEEDDF